MNRVDLVGSIGKDIEARKTQNGISTVSFSLAVDRNRKDADGNRITDWINIVAWRGTADFIVQYFKKGMRIGVSGSIQTRSYTAQDGAKRYVTEVVADNVEFVESASKAAQNAAEASTDAFDDYNDELPF